MEIPPTRKVCPICETPFWSYRGHKYCSKACWSLQDQHTPNYTPTPEEIKEQTELIRSGKLQVKGEHCVQPNWGPHDKRNKFNKKPIKCLKCLKVFQSLDPTRNRICPKCEASNKEEPREYKVHIEDKK